MKHCLWLVFACLPAVAQPRLTMVPWWDLPVARDLNLTDGQNKQIRATVSEYRTRLIDLRGTVEKAEGELEDAYDDEKFDTRRAAEAVDRLVNARADLTRTVSQMSIKIRTILTAQQWRELQRRLPSRGGGWEQPPGPGRGGPGMGRGRRQQPGSGTPAPAEPAPPPRP